jgi:uncharacterized iron-regulated protein
MPRLLVALSAVALAACAPTARVASGGGPAPAASQATPGDGAGANQAWLASFDRDHPLVGVVLEVRTGRRVELAHLKERVRREAFVLLGEAHDNPDHHRIQAELLAALTSGGRKPGVVFEMLDVGKQTVIEQQLAAHPDDVEGFALAVDWANSGWPDWSLYRPLFAGALAARLPVFAGGLDRAFAMRLAREGSGALDPELVERFALDQPLEPRLAAALRQEMSDAHCGLLPETMLDSMVLVQRTRDARLAERLRVASEQHDGAVLIAGAGHVRTDRAVPVLLQQAYAQPALSIGLLEVRHGLTDAAAHAYAHGAAGLPFDYVLFTPRASDTDHCAELREHMRGGARSGA